MDQKLKHKLNKRIEEGTLRSLSHFDGIDFYSNDYLGLANKSETNSVLKYGSTGSRLISGNSIEAIDCETFLANHFIVEAALVFNSGYDANIGLFSSVPQRGDTVLYDEMIHASIRDGIRLSFANSFVFKHNEMLHLEENLKKATGSIYIAIESLYSMNGDLAKINEILLLAKKYNANLIVDEAHACGVYGNEGRGLCEEFSDHKSLFARVITFGKAYGAHGACVLGSEELKTYLINFARSFIYTTALPPIAYRRIVEMVSLNCEGERKYLMENISFFRKSIKSKRLISDMMSPIQMLRVGDVEKTKELAEILQNNGIALKPIYSPTVSKGDEGIRICIHAFNSQLEILKMCELMHPYLTD